MRNGEGQPRGAWNRGANRSKEARATPRRGRLFAERPIASHSRELLRGAAAEATAFSLSALPSAQLGCAARCATGTVTSSCETCATASTLSWQSGYAFAASCAVERRASVDTAVSPYPASVFGAASVGIHPRATAVGWCASGPTKG